MFRYKVKKDKLDWMFRYKVKKDKLEEVGSALMEYVNELKYDVYQEVNDPTSSVTVITIKDEATRDEWIHAPHTEKLGSVLYPNCEKPPIRTIYKLVASKTSVSD